LFPSFAAFSITHGALLFYLNGFRHDNRFFVLGDDVVILDDSLAVRYKEVLADLGCPMSLNKTLDSSHVGEFAGKIIFPDVILPQLKWKDASDDSFVDFARHFGPRALRLLRPRQRKALKAICDIPEFLGGLGWNPSGVPLEERVAKYYRLFDDDRVSGSFLTGYNELFGKLSYGQQPFNSLGKIIDIGLEPTLNEFLVTFDQKVRAITAKELPLLIEWSSILGRNLMTVAPHADLPLSSGESHFRRTLLEVLESKLG